MILLQMNDISKSFGAEEILSNIKMEVKERDRIAVVGRNGAGKSTLLKIMAEEMTHDRGEIFKPKDLTFGYLAQHTVLESERSIWEEMIEVFDDLVNQEKKLRKLEEKIADVANLSKTDYEDLLNEYDRLQQSFQSNGGYTYEAEIKSVLNGLRFGDYDYNTPITELSGGQKTRLSLGKLLLQKPHLLILDEPTNHLDIETLNWLEGYLQAYPGAIVTVSHDRYFLDKTVSIVYEISRHEMKKYHGTYSKYLEQKARDYERELKQYEKQQDTIKKMEDFIQRNIARASTTKRARSRRKQLEKIDRLDKPDGEEASAKFAFRINRKSGNDVLKVHDLSFRYTEGDPLLFSNIHLEAHRGERIAIVGPNGVGKTTLLKTMTDKLSPEDGEIQLGAHVQIGYYDQEQAELNSSKTVLAELWDEYPLHNEKDIRTVLGNFLFSGDDVLKTVGALSGGEKARLALAKLMLQNANLLILDEPTNHLDLDSKEVLEVALMDFPGTILFVSHDRYFINKITDKIAEMNRDGMTIYLGDYDYYLEKKEEEAEHKRLNQEKWASEQEKSRKKQMKINKKRQSEQRKRKRRINELEETIEQKEKEISELQKKMTEPEVYEDHKKAHEMNEWIRELEEATNALMDEWTTLQDQLEE